MLLAVNTGGATPRSGECGEARRRQGVVDPQLRLARRVHRGVIELKAVLGNPHTGAAEGQAIARVVAAARREALA